MMRRTAAHWSPLISAGIHLGGMEPFGGMSPPEAPMTRQTFMVAELITDKRDISQLRGAYNAAFAQRARESAYGNNCARNPQPSAVEEARQRVRKAEAAYR